MSEDLSDQIIQLAESNDDELVVAIKSYHETVSKQMSELRAQIDSLRPKVSEVKPEPVLEKVSEAKPVEVKPVEVKGSIKTTPKRLVFNQ